MRPGFFYYRRHWERRTVLRLLALLLVGILAALCLMLTVQMRPLLESLATTRVSNTVNRIVSEAVNDAIQNGEISYEQLISLEKDNEGHVTAMHSNMAAITRLQAEILDIILARIDQVSARDLSIPLGTLTGSALLAGRGPRISVRMESVGSSSARFENQFESAGINQTKHQIVLAVDVSVAILLPGFTTATRVSTAFTVAETIIVGQVPDTYTSFTTTPSVYEEDAKNYILNR
jgi:sporulation protein YunB